MLNTMDRYTSEELTLCNTDKTFPKNEVFIVDDVYEGLDELSTIKPDRKVGRWIPLQLSMAHPPYQCSCCFRNAPMVETGSLVNRYLEALLTPYCPNCGAKMEEGKQE